EPGIDPNNNGQTWYRYSVIERSDVDRAIASAKAAVSDWDGIGAEARSAILNNAAQIMSDARAQTIAVMARDAGKTVSEADPEVSEAIDFARYYAHSAVTMAKGSHPVGVVLVVPPWNFPYAIPMGGICAALAAGNTVLLKPAPETVAVAWTIVNHLWQAGVPKNVLHFLPSRDDENGKYLVSHSDINSVILTGGFETARLFLSWKPDMPLMAETSGKNSIIISASADIDAAVKDLVTSAFGHAGQKCSAASLAIVEASIYENPSFIRQLEDAVTSLSVGSGMDFGTTVGPIIRPAEGALHRALTTLDDDESWLVAPQQLDDAGHLWRPGVKVGVKPGSWSHHNEWFGPVLGVMKAPNLERAIAWQSDVPYGLTAGIHSLNTQECEEWINKVQAGNLYINRGITGAIVNRQPFGGWKRSSV
ncbi:MAG: aldehyde dehydrogenase family protein, partial [Actinobacteria bacterium]|nr:aldehyde dehydrogenase family protein [Actinomycetota bacterium]